MNAPVLPPVPAHVPPHLIRQGDLWAHFAEGGADAFARVAALHDEMPPIFYVTQTGYMGGAWVARRQDDLRAILQDTDTFSSNGFTPFSRMLGEDWRLIPLEVDPPDHAKYRQLLNPLFSPKRVEELAPSIRAHAENLVSRFLARDACDFNADFADQFPTLVFLRLMGWPEAHADSFVKWTHTLIKSMDPQQVVGAVTQVRDYLRGRMAECRRAWTDDFIGYLMRSEVDGRPLTDDEIFGMAFLAFIGGLDTVASSLGFHFMHLARHPEQQAELRAHPDRIPQAVEEMLRAYSIVSGRRIIKRDVTIGGVAMKAGDEIIVSGGLGSTDPEKFTCPAHVDFQRADAHVPHQAFSFGPHRCVGSHLARKELRIALEVWLARVPPFHMTADPVRFRASGVYGLDNLHLAWTPAGAEARA